MKERFKPIVQVKPGDLRSQCSRVAAALGLFGVYVVLEALRIPRRGLWGFKFSLFKDDASTAHTALLPWH